MYLRTHLGGQYDWFIDENGVAIPLGCVTWKDGPISFGTDYSKLPELETYSIKEEVGTLAEIDKRDLYDSAFRHFTLLRVLNVYKEEKGVHYYDYLVRVKYRRIPKEFKQLPCQKTDSEDMLTWKDFSSSHGNVYPTIRLLDEREIIYKSLTEALLMAQGSPARPMTQDEIQAFRDSM